MLLDGFDPVAHIAIDGIDGFPGYKSNEPGTLDRAGIDYDMFDPIDYDVPGSFGVIYTSRQFLDDHPLAAQDFVRARRCAASPTRSPIRRPPPSRRSLSPRRAATRASCPSRARRSAGRPTPGCSRSPTPTASRTASPTSTLLQAEVDAYEEVGLFTEELPELTEVADVELAASVYDAIGHGHLDRTDDRRVLTPPDDCRPYSRSSMDATRDVRPDSPGRAA